MPTQSLEKNVSLQSLQQTKNFIHRHIGPTPAEIAEMLDTVDARSLDDLIESTVPASILLDAELQLPEPNTEPDALKKLREYATQNRVQKIHDWNGLLRNPCTHGHCP